jgi:hypothetical protein
MSWKSFDNDLSVDINILTPENNFKKNLPRSEVSKFDLQRRVNLFPFKIVTLQWLVDIGKVTPKNDNANLPFGGNWGNYFMFKFSPSDKYLPIGDIYLQGTDKPYDLNQVPVLLVKNDAYGKSGNVGDFCAIIDTQDINNGWSGDHYKCSGGQGTRHFNVKIGNNDYKSNYKVLSSFIGIAGFWDANQGITSAFAAVNKKYLKEIDGTSFYLGNDGGSGCYHDFDQTYSTPFYNFFVVSSRAGGGGWRVTDIVPRNLIASCCAKTLPENIDHKFCGDYFTNQNACKIGMDYYCKGDNLTTQECKSYCKINDCDTNLQAYCEAGTYEEQKKKYNEQKEICSCFMPRTFYEKKDDEKYSAMGPAGQKLKQLLITNNVYGDKPECSDLQCRVAGTTIQHKSFRGDAVDCRNLQIQNCINDASIKNQGNLKGSVSTDQANNCVQQSSSSPTPSPTQSQPSSPTQSQSSSPTQSQPSSPTEEPAPPAKNNTMLYIIIGIVLLLVIIGVVVFLLMGDSSSPAAQATPVAPVASRVFSRRK